MGLNMQRFWTLEQVSVVLSKLPAFLPANMPYNDRRNPSYAVQSLSLRDRRSRAAPPIGDLSRIRDIALRYPLSRAAPYKIKKKRSHHFVQAQMDGITVF